MKSTLITFLLSILISLIGFSQKLLPAEIHTLEGETISGFIQKTKNYSQSILFKTDPKAAVSTYTPKDIKGFTIDKQLVYEAAEVNLKTVSEGTANVFLQKLLEGKTALYQLEYETNSSVPSKSPVYYFLKTQGENAFTLIEQDNYQNQIKAYFQTYCGDKVQETTFSYIYSDKGLTRLVDSYNQLCSEESTKALIRLERKKTQLYFNIGAGYSRTIIQGGSSLFEDFVFENGTGLNVHFIPEVVLIQGFSVFLGLNYQQLSAHGVQPVVVNEFYINEGEILQLDTHIDFQYLHLLPGLKYRFTANKFSSFINAGVLFGIGMNNNVSTERLKFVSENSGNRLVEEFIESAFAVDKLAHYNLGWRAGLGLEYQLSEQMALYFSYQIQKGANDAKEGSSIRFENTIHGLHVGVKF